MNKKSGFFAIFTFVLTACSSHQAVEIATDEENTLWEHSTPKSSSADNTISSNVLSQETGWIPEGQNTKLSTQTYPSLSAENFAPIEIKPTIRHRTVKDDIYTTVAETNPEVVRYDRYLLVDSSPKDGQKYLLEQMVTVNMKGVGLTVEQGMWNTLNGTGYRLCGPIEQSVVSLFSLPLPNVHYKFGPVRLRDAMQMLAGAAYELTVNDALRQVCYVPRDGGVPIKTFPQTLIYADSEV